MEFDLDKALEEVPIHVEDPPPPSTPPQPQDRSTECLSELPPVELTTLKHCTKTRPKPMKRTKPSREAVSGAQRGVRLSSSSSTHVSSVFFLQRESSRRFVTHEAEQNSIMGKLDEGLEDFFYKKVIKLSFK